MRIAIIVVGVLVLLMGIVWLLQGVGIIGGSFMTGQPLWAVIGIICIVLGAGAGIFGYLRKPAAPKS